MTSKVLVVDDDLQVAKAIRRLLRAAEFDVEIALDGPSALAVLEEFMPDMVLSDARMPRMSGAALLSEVRRRRPLTVCLLISGYVGTDEPGFECLKKPFEAGALVATIRRKLAARSVAP